jgi:uncharacterized repeat protein (TIGR01451 family)
VASSASVCRMGVLQAVTVTALIVLVGPQVQVRSAGPGEEAVRPAPTHAPSDEVRHRSLAALAAQPLTFEQNLGQQADRFDYLAAGHGYRVGLAPGGVTLALADRRLATAILDVTLHGGRADAVAEPLDVRPAVASYYRGNDRARWISGASTHGRVKYAGVYEGIDVVYYGNQRRLQYDFHVAPGADPAVIALKIDGASDVSVTPAGRLRMAVGDRVIEQDKPFTYQEADGARHEVPSRFVVAGGLVRFDVGEYDRTRPLVIDPVIAYATWYGGSAEDGFADLDLDADGNLIALGFTVDLEGLLRFPTTAGVHKTIRNEAAADAFVTKFASNGTVIFSTLLGGAGAELLAAYSYDGGIAVGANGEIHVTGTTASVDFPVTAGAHDTDYNDNDAGATGSRDGFYVRLSSTGGLLYGTYFGGRRHDEPHGIDVDAAGNAYISGSTDSDQTGGSDGGFTVTPGAYDGTKGSIDDMFLLRFNPAGQLTYATYLGGNSGDGGEATDVRVSRVSANVVYVVGDSRSSDFPTTPATRVQAYNGSGDSDGVLVRLDLSQTGAAQLTYGTFLGGSDKEFFTSLALDGTDRVYVTGTTSSNAATFPAAVTLPGSIAPSSWDVVVAKFNTAAAGAASLVYASRINGWYTDTGSDVAVDSLGQAWIGVTSGSFSATPNPAQDFPVINTLQTARSGNGAHSAVVQLSAPGNAILMSSLIGGNSGGIGPVSLAITAADEVWVGGSSAGGTDRLGVVTPIQATYGGGDADATLQRIGRQADLTITKTVDKPHPQVTVVPGETMTYTLTVANATGDTVINVVVTDNLPAEVVFVSCASTAGGVCGGAGNNRTITIPSLAQGASATITIAVTVAPAVGPGQIWTNTATVTSGGTVDPNPANNTGNIGGGAPTLTNPAADADGDGLPNGFEQQFGLNGLTGGADNGATGDPDGDGKTNAQELAEGTHPRGFVITYLAEGATGSFFDTRLALANPTDTQALVLTRFQKGDGSTVRQYTVIPPFSRATVDVETLAGLEAAEFSTLVEADVQVVADRTMTWDGSGYGSHAERGILTRTATKWYFAEGATFGPFNLFYLIQNPNAQTANVTVTYLLPTGTPLTKQYTVGPQSRFNIWVDSEGASDPALAALANAELSAIIESTNGVPIIAERAMYLDQPGRPLGAGHESAGVTAPSTQWFLAEGATGSYFDLFILIANPQAAPAAVQAEFLLASGQVITKQYSVNGNSRFNIWVDLEDAALADAAVSTRVTSTNGVPIIVERSMWWPGPTSDTWQEAHNSPGEVTTGTRWAMAEGEVGGARDTETYVLIANTSPFAGTARVTVLFEDGTSPLTRDFSLNANSRSNVAPAADFPETIGKRFGMLVESVGATPAQIVVERAMYSDSGGVNWAAGTNALATKLP